MITLMLVSDHDMFIQSLRVVLELEDDIAVIATANTVAEAITGAVTHVPDVILLDQHLPDGDGIAAAARIMAAHPCVKIVLLTNSDGPYTLQRAFDAGCVGYLDKTGTLDELTAAVRVAATGHVVIPADDLTKIVPRTRGDVASLTRREREILHLIAQGMTNKAIAERLVLSVHTVRTHVQKILAKLGAHSKLEAAAVAQRRGLLD